MTFFFSHFFSNSGSGNKALIMINMIMILR